MFSSLKSLGALNKYLIHYKYYLLGGIVFIGISNYFRVLQPKYFREALDMIIETVPMYNMVSGSDDAHILYGYIVKNIMWFGVFVILQALIMGIFMYFMRQTIIVMSRLIEYDMRKEMYAHAQYLDTNFYKQNATGDLMARFTEDVSRVRQYLGPSLLYGFNLITLFVLVIYAMYEVNPTLATYSLLPLPFLSWSIFKISEKINHQSSIIQTQLSKLSTLSLEILSGIRDVKSYAQEGRMQQYFAEETEIYLKKNIDRTKVDSMFFPIIVLVIGISSVFTLWIGSNQVIMGDVTPGNIAEFFIYITLLTWPITALGWTASLVQQAAASQKRINEFLETDNSFENGVEQLHSINHDIHFENVSLTYPDTGITAIKEVSFTLSKGNKTAIIGETASGKSTIAYLLMQLYRPDQGTIKLGDQNIADFSIESWRDKIGYVPQDSFLFSDSVKNNISFGLQDEARYDHIEKYADHASVHEDIMTLPKDYHTMVGERGVTLSGGQKQRISLARSLITQPELLILDNSLSAVDTDTEQRISNYLKSIDNDLTMVIITQRINNIIHYDRIITMSEGRVIENGTHEELLAAKGYYYNLYQKLNKAD
ncbi:MAG: ABC transporter ATP-binding protein [Saprospiraceae bacterium]|nr:ABC transporter ATP-binding protein [Saprospiraceae bacterium]MCA0334948.1 ABC transporter ATP-binding protein/permease [Bacteroidota bacterium]MCB0603639.1 ABC transporter ATP-binding protein [Saprospiraceae bacterium]